MNIRFLVNPLAGRGRGRKVWQRIASTVERMPDWEVLFPATGEETRRMAEDAVRSGVDRLVILGGDGTVNTVADALAGTDTTLGVIPAGTGNDFCRNTGIPLRPLDALRVALSPSVQRVDLGRLSGGRHFVNAAGIGFDAQVARLAAKFPDGLGGNLPYLLGALSTLRWFRPTEVEVSIDGQTYTGPSMLVVVANGHCYGGGMKVAPLARPDDGQLDVCILTGGSRLQLLQLLGLVYSGGHVRRPEFRFYRGKRVQVRAPFLSHLDGEAIEPEELDFEVRPQALSVAMPPLAAAPAEQVELGYSRYGTRDSAFYEG